MTLAWPPERNWLQAELRRAILSAPAHDAVLFGRGASERSIMFRIGRYLAPAVEEGWPGRLWVDCEYNRIASDTEQTIAKQVAGLADADDKKRSVFPDLIVHDRSGCSKDHNILVVEAKKSPAGRRGVEYDLLKLSAYQRELLYQHAVYLELGTTPRWQWMEVDHHLHDVADLHAGNAQDATLDICD